MIASIRTISSPASVLALTALLISAPALATTDASPGEVSRAMSVADDLSIAFEHASSVVAPSVVTVRSATRLAGGDESQMQPFANPFRNSPFREFFGDDFFKRFQMPSRPHGQFIEGQGTGFIVSDDGYILTNNHVVDGATNVTVQLHDDREFQAKVVGTDASTDLALLRIEADHLTPIRFGSSEDLKVGAWVVAVGNPFGLDSTITAGIVSAKGRSRVGIADYENFIQTDAAINPGNSGGPLVNLRGEVVGVNTAIATRSGGNMGIGFAIPSRLAQSVMKDLRENGVVTRGWLGVIIQDLNEGLAKSFGFQGTNGALVSQVQDDSPAMRAGLEEGDIITEVDGHRLSGVDDLRMRISQTDPGIKVELSVFRDGKTRTFEVKIGRLEPSSQASNGSAENLSDELGLQLRDLDEQTADQLGVDVDVGVVVTGVEPLSAAARAGLRPRDVITHVQAERVQNVRAFRRALREHDPKSGVRLTIRSGQTQRFAFLRMPTESH